MICHISVALRIYVSTVPFPQQSAYPFLFTAQTGVGEKHAQTSEGRKKRKASPALRIDQTDRLPIRLRGVSKIRLHSLEALGEQCLRFSVIHGRSNDAILSILPVGRRSDLEL